MASTDASAPRGATSWLADLFSAGPAKPGDAYGAPGMGNSTSIAIATSIGIFVLWYLITMPALGPMIKPLFLPAQISFLLFSEY